MSDKSAEPGKEEEESSQPEQESEETKVPNNKEGDDMELHAYNMHKAISRIQANRNKTFYFLTIPGILRIVEFFVALLNISFFGYYCTYYQEVENMLPPFCLAQSREQYFMLSNYHSLIGCLSLVVAGIVSSFSNAALISSLYPLVFDSFQAVTVSVCSVALMQFYRASSENIAKVMPKGAAAKEGMAFSGFLLACLHVASAIYDGLIFFRNLYQYRQAQKTLKTEERALLQEN